LTYNRTRFFRLFPLNQTERRWFWARL